jgi:hypothetical protein
LMPAGLNVDRSVVTGVKLRSIAAPDIDGVDTDRCSSGDFSAFANDLAVADAGCCFRGGDDDGFCRFTFIEMPSPRPSFAGASSSDEIDALRFRGERAYSEKDL